ncbi:response regulator, partial [bacterium]|nr:response regulator [bacterium]
KQPEQDTYGHETILLVEDEQSLLELSQKMLLKRGYRVLSATTPREAITLAEKHAGEIHLLMTDIIMPEMNGRELADYLLTFHPNLKLLFMSGYTADVIAYQGILDQNMHFIQKPFSIRELSKKLRQALEETTK